MGEEAISCEELSHLSGMGDCEGDTITWNSWAEDIDKAIIATLVDKEVGQSNIQSSSHNLIWLLPTFTIS